MMNKKIFLALSLGIFLIPFSSLFSQSEEATNIFENYKQGVITFVSFNENKEEIGQGSGFIIGEKILVTSYGLVCQAKEAEGRDFKGKKVKLDGILAVDKNFGIALVQINRKDPVLTLGNSDRVEKKNKLYAIGGNEASEISVSEGELFNFHEFKSQRLIEATLSIPDEFSGAPVFDSTGEVIGMIIFLDLGRKIVVPSNVIKILPKTRAVKKFKDWQKEDYFFSYEGANLAAEIFYSMNETGKAEKFLNKVIELKPDDLHAHLLLASVYSQQRAYSSALTTYQKIVELDSNRDDAYFGLGLVNLRMSKWKEAIPPLEKSVQLNMDNKEAYLHIGTAYQELREFDKAVLSYKQYLETSPNRPWDAYNQLGLSQMETEEFADAAHSFTKALEGYRDDIAITYKLAQAYEKAGQIDQAATTYEKLAELSPEDAKRYYNMVIMMYNTAKMPDKAAEVARKMIERNPDDTEALYNLGFMYVQMEKYNEAIEAFGRVIEKNPGMEYAHLQIGYSYTQLKQYSKAAEAYKKMLEIFPDKEDAWFGLGIAFLQLKKYSEAIEPLRKVIELNPSRGYAYYNLAISYLNLRDNYSAREVYNQLNKIDPELAQKLKQYIK
jgi:tetratricopeptide (TPR) repeat protein